MAVSAAARTAIAVERLRKTFRVPHRSYSTLKELALHPRAARAHDTLTALEDVSFEVAEGEFFGIVGRNGSGKSTLLRCLAGIYAFDSGTAEVDGRLSTFIELGAGFHPELTARDNVVTNAVLLGLTPKQARRAFDEIIAFAELEEFVDLPLKNYSSGMNARLGFAVAIQVDAEILFVDEVLAVGDASFQAKCFDAFERLKREGRTILFVSHDMSAMRRFSDRALVLEKGRAVDVGPPDRVALRYEELNFGQTPAAGAGANGRTPPVHVLSSWCEDASGSRAGTLERGEACTAIVEVEFRERMTSPGFVLTFRNDVRHTILVLTSALTDADTGSFDAGERVFVRFSFDAWLAPSTYTVTASVLEDGRPAAEVADLFSLDIRAERRSGGVVDIPSRFEVVRT